MKHDGVWEEKRQSNYKVCKTKYKKECKLVLKPECAPISIPKCEVIMAEKELAKQIVPAIKRRVLSYNQPPVVQCSKDSFVKAFFIFLSLLFIVYIF